jgi:hypothetical protein
MNRRIKKKQITRDCRTKIQNDRYRIKLLRVYLSIYKKWIYVGDGGFSHPNCDFVLRLLPIWYHPTNFAHWGYGPHHTPVIIDIDMLNLYAKGIKMNRRQKKKKRSISYRTKGGEK